MEQSSNIEDKLELVFSHVNDWLKFAENKNTTVLATSAGLIWGASRIFSSWSSDLFWINIVLIAAYLFAIFSFITCLSSLLPILSNIWFRPRKIQGNENMLYFGDIAKFQDYEYLKYIKEKLNVTHVDSEWEKDYSNQIVNNASIAWDKYSRFRIASWLLLISIVFFGLVLIIKVVG